MKKKISLTTEQQSELLNQIIIDSKEMIAQEEGFKSWSKMAYPHNFLLSDYQVTNLMLAAMIRLRQHDLIEKAEVSTSLKVACIAFAAGMLIMGLLYFTTK